MVTWSITWCITLRMAASLFHMITNHSSLSTRHGSRTWSGANVTHLWILSILSFIIYSPDSHNYESHRVSLIDQDVGTLWDELGCGDSPCLLVGIILHSVGSLIVFIVFWVVTNIRKTFGRKKYYFMETWHFRGQVKFEAAVCSGWTAENIQLSWFMKLSVAYKVSVKTWETQTKYIKFNKTVSNFERSNFHVDTLLLYLLQGCMWRGASILLSVSHPSSFTG